MERSCAGSRSTPPGCASHDRLCVASAAAVRGSGDRRAPETRRSIALDAPAGARSSPADRWKTSLWIASRCVEVAQMPAASGSRQLRETSLTGRSGRGGGGGGRGGRGGTEPLAFVRHRESSCSASGEGKGFLKLRRATSATSGEQSFNLKTHPVTRTHAHTQTPQMRAWNTRH